MSKMLLFGGKHCGACKRMSAMLDSNGVDYEYLDIEENQIQAQLYNVGGLPTMIFLNSNDTIIDSKVGMTDITTINRLLNK